MSLLVPLERGKEVDTKTCLAPVKILLGGCVGAPERHSPLSFFSRVYKHSGRKLEIMNKDIPWYMAYNFCPPQKSGLGGNRP
jgi:hypothetical protein